MNHHTWCMILWAYTFFMIDIDNAKIKKISLPFGSSPECVAVALGVLGSVPRLVLDQVFFVFKHFYSRKFAFTSKAKITFVVSFSKKCL